MVDTQKPEHITVESQSAQKATWVDKTTCLFKSGDLKCVIQVFTNNHLLVNVTDTHRFGNFLACAPMEMPLDGQLEKEQAFFDYGDEQPTPSKPQDEDTILETQLLLGDRK